MVLKLMGFGEVEEILKYRGSKFTYVRFHVDGEELVVQYPASKDRALVKDLRYAILFARN